MVFCRFRTLQRNYAEIFFKPFEKKLMSIGIKISLEISPEELLCGDNNEKRKK